MRSKYWILASLLALGMVPPYAYGDGILIPHRQPDRPVFSVKYHHVDVFIDEQAATTKVDQIFHNETAIEEEATYVFPLPKGATITKFTMFIGEKEVQGRILDRDEARKLYESIVRRRKDPALLEYMDRNTFRARVYPIPAHGDKRIRLEYREVVAKNGNLCRYVYPLSTERFSSKPLADCRVTIHLKSSTHISNIYSPSHVVKVERTSRNEAVATWSARDVKPDTDLVLYYSLAPKDLALDVMTFKDDKGKGYFMLLASPPVKDNGQIMPKSVVFVLDRTGSMAGEKITQAKNALKHCLNSLKAHDRFNLIMFSEIPDPLWDGLRPASKANIKEALAAVVRAEASGGTNLHDAIGAGLNQLASERSTNTLRFMVLLTDGLPTVGETSTERILQDAKEGNKAKARIFAFGVGYDVNAHLLDLLVEQNNGVSEYVLPNEDIEVKVSSFFASINEPLLTETEITAKGVRISQTYPSPLPDIFKGSQLIVLGRYEGSGKATFVLSGKNRGETKTWTTGVDMTGNEPDKDFIPLIWAARRIGYLLDQVRLHRSDELIEEIVRLSKEWGIPTEFTSFLVDEDVPIPLAEAVDRVFISVKQARSSESGTWGVYQSVNQAMLKTQAQVPANAGAAPSASPDPYAYGAGGQAGSRIGNVRGYFDAEGKPVMIGRVQNIGTRTFYLRGNQWVDQQTEGQQLKALQIKQFSNAHFKLLNAYPELAKYQKLGNVRLLVNSQVIEIGPEGKEDLTDAEIKAILGNTGGERGRAVVPSTFNQKVFAAGQIATSSCVVSILIAALLRRHSA